MVVELGRIASFLSAALLAGLLPAQEKPKTVDELRKENAALRQQVKTLRAQLGGKTSKASKKAPKAEQKVAWEVFVLDAPVRLDLGGPRRKRITTTFVRLWDLEGKAHTSLGAVYRKSLEALTQAKRKLDGVKSPTEARVIVDEIERALLDVRRALWKLEQAEKKKAKDPARKQSNSPEGRIMVPVLAVPIQLDLNWPILSGRTVLEDQLFFTFRRF